MYRVSKMGNSVYAVWTDLSEEEIENIKILVAEGTSVLIVDELSGAEMHFDEDIELVE